MQTIDEAVGRAARAMVAARYLNKDEAQRQVEHAWTFDTHVKRNAVQDAKAAISAFLADVPVSEGVVDAVASILAPQIKWYFGSNPDCDDQNAAQDNARRLARACIKAMSAKLAEEIQ